jgi:hypothetical protein
MAEKNAAGTTAPKCMIFYHGVSFVASRLPDAPHFFSSGWSLGGAGTRSLFGVPFPYSR